ncbi:MAG: hypothetical protein U0930_22810 [Pirellulales bacterium]
MIPYLMNVVLIVLCLITHLLTWRTIRNLKDQLTEAKSKAQSLRNQNTRIRQLIDKATQEWPAKMVLVLSCLFSTTASAQQVQSIVSNGQLQNRDFTLLVIHNNDQASGQVLNMLTRPQTEQMQRWAQGLNIRPMQIGESFVQQHHQDLVQKHQGQLPIVALVDPTGGVWWSAAGGQIPLREQDLIKQLSDVYQQTLIAAQQSPLPAQTNQTVRAQSFDYPAFPPQSRFIDRGVAAPDPIRVPSVNVNTTSQPPLHPQQPVADETFLLIGVLCVVCSLILAAAPVIGSTIIASAMTDEDPNHSSSQS